MEIGVVGATGLVGNTLVKEIIDHVTVEHRLHLFARNDTELHIDGLHLPVHSINALLHHHLDIALFATPAEVSLEWIPLVRSKTNTFIIDGSSAFRQRDNIPLVIPEITTESSILNAPCISSPNCTTTLALMALHPLHKLYG